MAGQNRNLNYTINFKVNKANLSQIQQSLSEVMQLGKKNGLQETVKTAESLRNILTSSWNSKLGQLDLTSFNSQLQKSGLSLKDIQTRFEAAGSVGQTAFAKIAKNIADTTVPLKQTNKLLQSMATSFKNTVKWQISSKAINMLVGSVQRAYNYTKDLDTSLNNIRIVTQKSAEEMDRFAVSANRAAKQLGAGTLDYTNASLIYYQQGLSDDEVAARADVTLKTANVTGQSAAQVSEQLTAVWNGFKVAVEDSQVYVDKLAAVAASTASNLQELSTGMSKVASTANAMGVDIDQLTAQLSTIVSVTRQAPQSVGNALKTIYARMGDLKVDGVDEFGTTLGDVSGTLEKVGIQVLDAQGNLRDLGIVTEEVAAKWQGWTQAQRQAIAISLAGKRQYNNLIALFENWEMYEKALSTAATAAGTLQQQQDTYMESARGQLQQLRTEAERTYDILLNPEGIVGISKVLDGILSYFNDFIEGIGGGGRALLQLGTIAAYVFRNQIGAEIDKIIAKRQILNQQSGMLNTMSQLATLDNNFGSSSTAGAIEAGKIYKQIQDSITVKDGERLKMNVLLTEQHQKHINDLAKEAQQLGQQKQYLLNIVEQYKQLHNIDIGTADRRAAEIEALQQQKRSLQDIKQIYSQLKALSKHSLFDNTAIKFGAGESFQQYAQVIQRVSAILNNTAGRQGWFPVEKAREFDQAVKSNTLTWNQFEQALDLVRSKYHNLGEEVQNTASRMATVKQTSGIDGLSASLDNCSQKAKNFGESVDRIANRSTAVQRVTASFSILNGVLTAVAAGFNNTASAAEKSNSVLSGLSTAAMGIGMAVGGPFGAAIGMGVGALLKPMSDLLGITKALQNTFKTDAERAKQLAASLDKAKQGISNMAAAANSYHSAVADVESLREQYERLSEKAGAYDKQIDRLTKEEADQYAQLKDKLLSYNDEILLGYDVKHRKILSQKDAIDLVLQKLKEEYQLQRQIALIDSGGSVQNYAETLDNYREFAPVQIYQKEKEKDILEQKIGIIKEGYRPEYSISAGRYYNDHRFRLTEVSQAQRLADAYSELQGVNSELAQLRKQFAQYTTMDAKTMAKQIQYASKVYDTALNNIGFENMASLNQLAEVLAEAEKEAATTHIGTDYVKAFEEVEKTIGKIAQTGNEQLFISYIDSMEEYAESFWSVAGENYIDQLNNKKDVLIQYLLQNEQFFNMIGKQATQLLLQRLFKIDITKLDIPNKNVNFELSGADDLYASLLEKEGARALFASRGPATLKDGTRVRTAGEVVDSSYLKQIISTQQVEQLNALYDKYGENIFKIANGYQQLLILSEALNAGSEKNVQMIASIQETLSSGVYNDLSEQQLAYLDGLQQEKQYLDLIADKYSENSHEYKTAIREIQQLEEERYKAALQAERFATYVKIEGLKAAGAEKEQIEKAMQQFIDIDRKITIAVELDFQSDLDQGFGLVDELQSLQTLVPQDLLLGYKEVQQLIKDGYGQILQGAQATAQGQIQLNEDVVNAFIEGEQAKIDAAIDAKIQEIDMQLAILDAQEQALDDYEKALAAGDVATAQSAAQRFHDQKKAFQDTLSQAQSTDNKIEARGLQMEKVLGTSAYNIQDAYETAFRNMAATAQLEFGNVQTAALSMEGTLSSSASRMNNILGSVRSMISNVVAGASSLGSKASPAVNGAVAGIMGVAGGIKFTNNTTINDAQAERKALNTQKGSLKGTKEAMLAGRNSLNNFKTNLGKSSGSGGSKNKEKEAEQMQLLDKQIDIYRDINEQLEKYAKKIDRIQKVQQKLVGKELIKALEEEQQLLDKQAALYKTKQDMLIQDLANRKATLMINGAIFDSESHLLNSAEILRNKQAEINGLIAQYNSMTAQQQEGWKDYINNKKKEYDTLASQINEYENSLNSEFQAIIDKLQEIKDRKIEIQIKKFNTEIDIKLNYHQAEKDLAEFRRKVQKQILDDDFLGLTTDKVLDFNIFYKTNGEGTIQKLTDHVNRIMKQGDIMQATGWSEIYGDNMVRLLEDLKKYNDELMQALQNVEDLVDEIHGHYLDMIDKSKSAFDKQVKTYEQIDKLISHNVNLMQKIYGENVQYDSMLKWYDQRTQNNNQELDFLRQEVDLWERMAESEKARLATMQEGTKEWQNSKQALDKYLGNWQDSLNELNSKIEDSVENLVNKWKMQIERITFTAQNNIFGGDMSKALSQWQHMIWYSDRYLDDLSRSAKLIQLDAKYKQAIDNTEDLKLQAKIQQLRDYQIKRLQQKVNLRQIDIDIAEKELELAIKQQALQDAQQTKTKMRLRRDSQGNYRYEYVADTENNKEQLENEYARIEQLRMLIKNDWTETTEEVSNMIQKMYKEMAEAAYRYQGDEQATRQAIAQIYNRYLNEQDGYITSLIRDAQEMQIKLNEATIIQLKELRDLYGQDFYKWLGLDESTDASVIAMLNQALDNILNDVSNFTGEGIPTVLDLLKDGYLRNWYIHLDDMNKAALMGYILPAWDSMVGRIIKLYDNKNNGLTAVIEKAINDIIDVTEEYIDKLAQLESVAGTSFWSIAEGIDQNIWKTQELLQNNYQLINSYQQQMMAMQQVIGSLQQLIQQFQQARQAAIEAATAAAMYYAQVARQQVQVPQIPVGTPNVPTTTALNPSPGSGGGGGGGTPGIGGGGGGEQTHAWKITFQDAYVTRETTVASGSFTGSNASPVQTRFNGLVGSPSASWNWKSGRGTLTLYIDGRATRSASVTKPTAKATGGGGGIGGSGTKVAAAMMATGGYTGTWGDEGRIAILHEKELVLNQDDTSNILGAVNIVRGIAERLSIASASTGISGNIAAMVTNNSASQSQNITIYADFPAANSAAEIEAAFNNIVNMASQRASKNRRSK